MKIFYRLISALIIFSILLSFSGCSFKFSSFDSLIRPPKLSGKYQGLQDSFERVVNDFTLVTPENGLYQSAFVIYDIDNDSNDEAFVFYKTENSNDIVNMYYFIFENEEWKPVSNITGLGSSVDSISFADFNADKVCEIVVGWTLFSSKTNKVFSVFNRNNANIVEIGNFPYSSLKIVDINGNGNDDIFTLSLTSTVDNETTASAKTYSFDYKTNTMAVIGEVKTDSSVSSYENIFVENNNGKNILYVDSSMGDNGMFTDVFYWDDDKNALVSPLFDATLQSTKITWRGTKISCFDIDGDSLYEIPISVEMNGSVVTSSKSNSIATANNLYFTKWCKFSNNSLKPISYSVNNDTFGFLLLIKPSWVGRITIISNDGQWDIYRYDSSNNEIGDKLFSIYSNKKNESNSLFNDADAKSLKSTNTFSFMYSITDNGKSFGIDEDYLENNFRIMNIGG